MLHERKNVGVAEKFLINASAEVNQKVSNILHPIDLITEHVALVPFSLQHDKYYISN